MKKRGASNMVDCKIVLIRTILFIISVGLSCWVIYSDNVVLNYRNGNVQVPNASGLMAVENGLDPISKHVVSASDTMEKRAYWDYVAPPNSLNAAIFIAFGASMFSAATVAPPAAIAFTVIGCIAMAVGLISQLRVYTSK